ncbi:glycosyltransferase [Gramella sp. KN1008]|uniref:glycosyltransferase n=1 Tax=Gramella sp. KN1008 TaxID=2529298 RepID=UPI00103B80C7|nr:glycosyltransferase [Gramella sp. KN1008]TBW30121.1 glycosyltransferase family 1 protein [Gramella sp. KN1008]
MKICLIYRQPEKSRHSIEKVFQTIAAELEDAGHQVVNVFHNGSLRETIVAIRKTNADIFHITGDIHYLSFFLPRKKTVLTIHDIGSFKNNSKTFKIWVLYIIWFFLPVHYLRKVTVVSRLTKNDIIKYTKVFPSKITVIDNPLSFQMEFSPKKISQNPKILQIGSGSHKNLRTLIQAVSGVNCSLIIIGKPDILEISLMKKKGINFQILFGITDEEMKQIYEEIDILFFASFSEGFGLPIIEAQAKGRPVITSHLSPMIEVSGGYAKLVDPNSSEEVRKAIYDIIENPSETRKIVTMGYENSLRYNPRIISEKYLDCYYSTKKSIS